MFEEFMGLPAHPLVLHLAVVFVPLLALLTVGYALVPPIRPHTRWVLALLALGAPVAALLARLSGDAFLERMRAANRVTRNSFRRWRDTRTSATTRSGRPSGWRSWPWHWSGWFRRGPPRRARCGGPVDR
ncbi:hypothetical protein NKG94_06190 [Micromonospora sp. M12]